MLARFTSAESQPSVPVPLACRKSPPFMLSNRTLKLSSHGINRYRTSVLNSCRGHFAGTLDYGYCKSSDFSRSRPKVRRGAAIVTASADNRWFQGGGGRQNNRFGSCGSDGRSGEGSMGWSYPWESDAEASAWEARRQSITFFTSEGVFQIHELAHVPVPTAPPSSSAAPSASPSAAAAAHRFSERRYMDPQQGLCLASLFDIRAFNGLDASRLFCVAGFCRSPEMLSDVVADTVLMAGGEVVDSKLEMGQGLHAHLRLTVALPYLFGVPPALDALNRAIRLGGGIVDKSFHQWEMCL
ncbi:unnamed protein product [Closterium sp. Yama58-4]|nr:unnamed protein product [Closterium sp. Yama58-4]